MLNTYRTVENFCHPLCGMTTKFQYSKDYLPRTWGIQISCNITVVFMTFAYPAWKLIKANILRGINARHLYHLFESQHLHCRSKENSLYTCDRHSGKRETKLLFLLTTLGSQVWFNSGIRFVIKMCTPEIKKINSMVNFSPPLTVQYWAYQTK